MQLHVVVVTRMLVGAIQYAGMSLRFCGTLILALMLSACDDQPAGDHYPGDTAFTGIVQRLLGSVTADAIVLPWAGNRTLTKRQLCQELVHRHFVGVNAGQGETNARFLNCPDLDENTLFTACLAALNTPQGFPAGGNWGRWQGRHQGTWFDDNGRRFDDEAQWDAPRTEPTRIPGDNDSTGNPRKYDFQDVRWPGPPARNGWNQSHPEVPYVWGWDPKQGQNENGEIGTHIGFGFKLPPCEFIVWLTPKEGFLEGINTDRHVKRAVNGRTLNGYPKTSTGFNGRGQWVVN